MTLGHPPAPGDHIYQCAQEGRDDQEDDPDCLPPTAHIPIPEEIDDDLEQHNEITGEDESPHQQPEEIREAVHSNLQSLNSPEYRAVDSLRTSLLRGESFYQPSGSCRALVDMGQCEVT